MARKTGNFTEKERDKLRERLRAHAERYELKPQKISDQIVEKTGFATAIEGGRKRVERFMKAEKRQTYDFIAAVEKYLNQVAPEDVEESAIAVANLFTQPEDTSADLSGLVGSYEAYLTPHKSPSPWAGTFIPPTVLDIPAFHFEERRIPHQIAYALITMTPLGRSNALLVGEAIINSKVEPEIMSFPARPLALISAGIIIPFGRGNFLMVTKSANESRFFQLRRPDTDTGRFVGFLTFNGSEQKSMRSQYQRQAYDPDYKVELFKVAGIGEG